MNMTTTRALATPLKRNDFDAIINMYFEPDSNTFIKPLLNKTKEYYESFLEGRFNQNEELIGFWAVRSQESNEFIGTINLNFMEAIKGFHIGCHLRKNFWGKGYATELLTALLDVGINEMNLDQVYGLVEKGHDVSKKMLLKVGLEHYKDFELDGCILEQYMLRVS